MLVEEIKLKDSLSINAEQSERCSDEAEARGCVRTQKRLDRWLNGSHF